VQSIANYWQSLPRRNASPEVRQRSRAAKPIPLSRETLNSLDQCRLRLACCSAGLGSNSFKLA
jgi:hypothetical protein